jgi:hypothetical protein
VVGPCLCPRDQFERVAMLWTNDTEMAVVQGGDSCGSEAFSDGDEAGVGATEAQILVAVDQLANPLPIRPGQRLDSNGLLEDRGVEGDLSDCSDLTVDQMRGFGDHQRGGDQRAVIGSSRSLQA